MKLLQNQQMILILLYMKLYTLISFLNQILIFCLFFHSNLLCLILLYKDTSTTSTHKFFKKVILLICFSFFFTLICSVYQATSNFIAQYSIRFYPPIIALPFSLLIWWMYEIKKVNIQKNNKVFLLSCILFVLVLCFLDLILIINFIDIEQKSLNKYLNLKVFYNGKYLLITLQMQNSITNYWIGIVGRFIKFLHYILDIKL